MSYKNQKLLINKQAHHCFLFWASFLYSTPYHPIFFRSILKVSLLTSLIILQWPKHILQTDILVQSDDLVSD
jgi:hypothetical protein